MPERLLIVMPNWFGETLFATPFLRVLRNAKPQAFIGALGVSRAQEVLAGNPCCDAFLLYDEHGAHRSLGGKRKLIAALRAMRVDTAVILRRSLSRTWMLVLAGIPRRIGFANLKSGWLLTDRVRAATATTHKASAYLQLLGPFGIAPTPVSYEYHVSATERVQARQLLQDVGVRDGLSLIILHPGANWAHKRWLPERFAQLADRLARHHSCAVVFTGDPDDVSLVQRSCRQMTTQPIVLAGKTTLRQLAACLEIARLVVSNDTGVVHIASALKRPVVALYGPTSPAITGPVGNVHDTIVIHHPTCCPQIPCFNPDRPAHPGMASITVEEVFNAAKKLLGNAP